MVDYIRDEEEQVERIKAWWQENGTAAVITVVLAVVLFALYFLFVLNEERWLLKGYGQAFADYMRSTPRFVDERSLERLRAAL